MNINKKMYLATLIIAIMDFEEMRNRNNKRLDWASGIIGIFFGGLIAFIGVALFKKNNFGIAKLQEWTEGGDDLLMKLFGGICVLYGVWRIFRAIAKIKNG